MITRIALLLALLAVRGFSYTANDGAKTISSDGSATDTNNAIAYVAAKNQDAWVLTAGTPGGSYSWGAVIAIDVGNHSFTFQGAASGTIPSQGAAPSGQTDITTSVSSGFPITVSVHDGKVITIKDFAFADWNSANNALFVFSGYGDDTLRLTNCRFAHGNSAAIAWVGTVSAATGLGPYGLFDHLSVSGTYSGYGIYVRDTTNSWSSAMTWGTKKAVYIEDSVFTATNYQAGVPAFDGNQGCRVVCRYNAFTNHSCVFHGSEPDPNGGLQLEWMHNVMTATDGVVIGNAINLRSGTCYAFGNTLQRTGTGFYINLLTHHYSRAVDAGEGIPGNVLDRFVGVLSTTIAAGSNGQSLPQATINVASTATINRGAASLTGGDFNIFVTTGSGVQTVHCTGLTTTTFTGCTGGAGAMSTGGAVTRPSDYLGTQMPGCGVVGSAGQDPQNPSAVWGSVPIHIWGNTINAPLTSLNGGNVGGFLTDDIDIFLTGPPAGYAEYTYPHPLQGAISPVGSRKIGRGSSIGGAPALAR